MRLPFRFFAKSLVIRIFLILNILFAFEDISALSPELSRLNSRAKQGDKEAQKTLELVKQAQILQITYDLRPLLQTYGGFGTSIQFDIVGDDPESNDIYLLIAVPLYSDAAVNTAFSMLSDLIKQRPNRGVRVAFLADEQEEHRGLLDQLDQFDDPESVVILYGDFLAAGNHLYLYQGSKGHVSPRQLVEQSLLMAEEKGISIELPQPYNELYRFGWVQVPEALQLIQDRGHPALYVSDYRLAYSEKEVFELEPNQAEKQVAFFLKALVDHIPRDTSTFDYHYTILAFNKHYRLMNEKTIIGLIILSVFSIILFFSIYSIVLRRKIIHFWIVFLRRSWVILIYFMLLVASLYLSRLLFLLWSLKHGSTTQYPEGVALLFLLLWLSLFSLASPITQNIVIPKRASFYGHGAIIVLVLGMFTAILLDITLIPIFVWALLWGWIGSFVHSFSMSLFSTILAPTQMLILFLIGMMNGTALNSLFISFINVKDSLLLAFFVLPFVLLWKRTALLRIQKSKRKGKAAPLHFGRYIFAAAMIISLFILEPYKDKSKGQEAAGLAAEPTKSLFNSKISQSVFFNQRSVTVTISANTPIERYEISLERADPKDALILIESTIPFKNRGINRMDSDLASHPDNPFYFDLLLPRDQELTIRIKGVNYSESTEEVRSLP